MRTQYLENPSQNKTLLIVTTLISSLSVFLTSSYTVYSQFQVSCEYCFHFWRHGFKSQSLIWPKIWKPCQVTELKLSKKKTFCWKEDDDKFIMIFFFDFIQQSFVFLTTLQQKGRMFNSWWKGFDNKWEKRFYFILKLKLQLKDWFSNFWGLNF